MSGSIYEKPTRKVWRSSVMDFGRPTKDKILKEISFESVTDGFLEIECGNVIKTFNFKGKEGVQTIKPLMRGKNFKASFIVEKNNTRISGPIFRVGVIC